MSNEFSIALNLGGIMKFGAITKYTGFHHEVWRSDGEKKKDEKSKRIRKPRVTNTNPAKKSKSGITMKCSNCHGIGHNKTKCPQPPTPMEIKHNCDTFFLKIHFLRVYNAGQKR